MSEEEKKAIDNLKSYLDDIDLTFNGTITTETAEAYKVILNLIDKQQKEIEEKNITINKMAKDISIQLKEIEVLRKENFDTVYIQAVENFKDKIRAIINKSYPDEAVQKLIELLEE